jgi:hypothetical protein
MVVNIKRGTYEKGLFHKDFLNYLLSFFVIASDSGKHSTAYLEMDGSNLATVQAHQEKKSYLLYDQISWSVWSWQVFSTMPNKAVCCKWT